MWIVCSSSIAEQPTRGPGGSGHADTNLHNPEGCRKRTPRHHEDVFSEGSSTMITELIVRLSRTVAGEIVMWMTVALSVISVAMMIERVIFFLTQKDDVRELAARLNKVLLDGNYDEAKKGLAAAKAFEAKVFQA